MDDGTISDLNTRLAVVEAFLRRPSSAATSSSSTVASTAQTGIVFVAPVGIDSGTTTKAWTKFSGSVPSGAKAAYVRLKWQASGDTCDASFEFSATNGSQAYEFGSEFVNGVTEQAGNNEGVWVPVDAGGAFYYRVTVTNPPITYWNIDLYGYWL